jgi:hypothetical protein
MNLPKDGPMRFASIARLALLAMLACAAPTVVPAQTDDPAAAQSTQIDRIAAAMQIAPMIDVMREEGLGYGDDLAQSMLDGPSDRWTAIVAGIYDSPKMQDTFAKAFAGALAQTPDALPAIEAFFTSERGQQIVTLEVEARRAMLDPSVEDAAKVLMQDMVANKDARMEMLQAFVTAGDLIEMNVVGALNANFAFSKGMAEAGGPAAQMTEDDMLADVWGQEAAVRGTTKEWLYSYFALAYQPLEDSDLEAYIAFWQSPEGRVANAALFAAFDAVFSDISHDLGRAVAVQMQGDDI